MLCSYLFFQRRWITFLDQAVVTSCLIARTIVEHADLIRIVYFCAIFDSKSYLTRMGYHGSCSRWNSWSHKDLPNIIISIFKWLHNISFFWEMSKVADVANKIVKPGSLPNWPNIQQLLLCCQLFPFWKITICCTRSSSSPLQVLTQHGHTKHSWLSSDHDPRNTQK